MVKRVLSERARLKEKALGGVDLGSEKKTAGRDQGGQGK